ncbi:hypothetical protein ACJX0J_039638 [Zea mays]
MILRWLKFCVILFFLSFMMMIGNCLYFNVIVGAWGLYGYNAHAHGISFGRRERIKDQAYGGRDLITLLLNLNKYLELGIWIFFIFNIYNTFNLKYYIMLIVLCIVIYFNWTNPLNNIIHNFK